MRGKFLFIINILSLSFGLAFLSYIYIWIFLENTFNSSLSDGKNIYKLDFADQKNNSIQSLPDSINYQDALNNVPGIVDYTRIICPGNIPVFSVDTTHFETSVAFIDPHFFTLFSTEIISKDSLLLQNTEQWAILTESKAKFYFGDKNPLGMEIKIGSGLSYTVVAIIDDFASNESFQYGILSSADQFLMNLDDENIHYTTDFYLQFTTGEVEKTSQGIKKQFSQILNNQSLQVQLTPFYTLRSDKNLGTIFFSSFYVKIFIYFGAVFILFCLTYCNVYLYIIRVKKFLSHIIHRKKQLVLLLLIEQIIMFLCALILALIIVFIFYHQFCIATGYNIELFVIFKQNVSLVLVGLVIFLFILFFSISFFSLYNSLIKDEKETKLKMSYRVPVLLRITGIMLFVVFGVLIGFYTVFHAQLNHMRHKGHGFQANNVFILPIHGEIREAYPMLKESWLREPFVNAVSACKYLPWKKERFNNQTGYFINTVTHDYATCLGLKYLAGRPPPPPLYPELMSDSTVNYLLNEKACEMSACNSIIDSSLQIDFFSGRISGVISNYYTTSIKQDVKPSIFIVSSIKYSDYILIKTSNNTNEGQSLPWLRSVWYDILNVYPFEFSRLEGYFDLLYKVEIDGMRVIIAFIILFFLFTLQFSITISEAESFSTDEQFEKKTFMQKMHFFDMHFRVSISSICIAFPLLWLFFTWWLGLFAYSIPFPYMLFVLCLIVYILIMFVPGGIAFFDLKRMINRLKSNP